MKSMTCNQLGGGCEQVFSGETFEDVAAQSQQHGKELCAAKDERHSEAMGKMMQIAKSGEMDSWIAARQQEFDQI